GIVLSTTVLCLISRKRLGGITGDVLGSVEVFGETAALLGIVFALA
ncbi:MAG: adenosylcobinamide-GDP ribazoletransferase, partial [Spirochaetales bacterium]|nr:adenosylcobinamide-GDP ribazoletransferase [Spirochaetales bacterium]